MEAETAQGPQGHEAGAGGGGVRRGGAAPSRWACTPTLDFRPSEPSDSECLPFEALCVGLCAARPLLRRQTYPHPTNLQ